MDRPIDGGVGLLRQFWATINAGEDEEPAGTVTGWLGWDIAYEDVLDAADAISSDAEQLGYAVQRIQDYLVQRDEGPVNNALLIDRMWLEPQYRGNRLAGVMIEVVADLFRLDPKETIIVLTPEPQRPDGGPYPDGRERDEAMSRLCAAYAESGLERWADTSEWWMPIR